MSQRAEIFAVWWTKARKDRGSTRSSSAIWSSCWLGIGVALGKVNSNIGFDIDSREKGNGYYEDS